MIDSNDGIIIQRQFRRRAINRRARSHNLRFEPPIERGSESRERWKVLRIALLGVRGTAAPIESYTIRRADRNNVLGRGGSCEANIPKTADASISAAVAEKIVGGKNHNKLLIERRRTGNVVRGSPEQRISDSQVKTL